MTISALEALVDMSPTCQHIARLDLRSQETSERTIGADNSDVKARALKIIDLESRESIEMGALPLEECGIYRIHT